MPSLAEVLARPDAPRPERTYELCLDGTIPAKIEALQIREQAILDEAAQSGPRKMGQGKPPELERVYAELAELHDALKAEIGVLTLRATPESGAWQIFVDSNPPRPEGAPGHDRDQRYANGVVNVDALVADLATYAYAWDGDALAPGGWEKLSAGASLGDLRLMATYVVGMYEVALDFQQWRHGLSTVRARLSSSASPEILESPRAD